MMATPVQPFDPEDFARTMQALRDGTSAADEPARPAFDLVQHREVVADAEHGRRIADYKPALERAGFTYWPANTIPPGCESTNPLEPPRPLVEGQWRRPASAKLPGLAFTESQVLAWFSGPEEFWEWLKTMAAKNAKLAEREARRPLRLAMPR